MDYNHPRWPSPRAKLVAKKLNLDNISPWSRDKIKRLTHQQALELLAKKAGKSVPEFLEMPTQSAWLALGSYTTYGWHNSDKVAYDPLYGPQRY
jgi:hypothetical protein